jgi:hypothetical protein
MRQHTENLIKQLDAYLRLTRFKYTDMEKLSRLHILEDYYNSKKEVPQTEQFSCQIECAEQLSGNLTLPLKVKGVFLTEGRPAIKYYSSEELQKAADNPINQRFPLMLDHQDTEAGKIIGSVDKISYDSAIKGLRWWGHINDETFARNVMDGIINQVSATIFSLTNEDLSLGPVAKDITFKELSLVMHGAEPHNSIQIDNG